MGAIVWWWLAMAHAANLESVLSSELERATSVFALQPEPVHYVALEAEDRWEFSVRASDGVLAQSRESHQRTLDVDLRVGTPELDSTHPLRGFSSLESDNRDLVFLPIDDAEFALRHAVARELDRAYRSEAEKIVMIRGERSVKADEEVLAPDFEARPPIQARVEVPELSVDRKHWEVLLSELSAQVERSEVVFESNLSLTGGRSQTLFLDSAGTRIEQGRTSVRLSASLQAIADDGDVVEVFDAFDAHSFESIPDEPAIRAWIVKLLDRLEALRKAPRGSPYSGPVLLTGRASAVLFHEVFGHRVEGHRQKRETEGRTFGEYIGQSLLPSNLDVYDDPTVQKWGSVELNGTYAYDDEGVPAQRAVLVEDSIFRGFLMSRSPLPDFPHSNGHGRRQTGAPALARMGNTIVEAKEGLPRAKMRAMLVSEAKKQGLPYGILVEDIEGGFTLTGRVEPNSFNVRANTTWKVFVDGRPDELIRGIDLVGTPLVAFNQLIAAGDDPEVFNGYCGAESGWVPVSGVAPSVLFRRLEFQLKEKGQERPPLLSKPITRLEGT